MDNPVTYRAIFLVTSTSITCVCMYVKFDHDVFFTCEINTTLTN